MWTCISLKNFKFMSESNTNGANNSNNVTIIVIKDKRTYKHGHIDMQYFSDNFFTGAFYANWN
jgi:hypothetical protein